MLSDQLRIVGIFAFNSLFGVSLALAQTQAPLKEYAPTWKDQILGKVVYSSQGADLRKTQTDLWTYQINESGILSASSFLSFVRPLTKEAFLESFVAEQNQDPRAGDQAYQDYLKKVSQKVFAVMVLSRVLDQEAMKKRVPPTVSRYRAHFAALKILVESATRLGKYDPKLSTQDLYQMLRNATREDLRDPFIIQWAPFEVPKQKGAADLLYSTIEQEALPLGSMTVALDPKDLPETFDLFEEKIYKNLKPFYLKHLRKAIWSQLLAKLSPSHADLESLDSDSQISEEHQKMLREIYQDLLDKGEFKQEVSGYLATRVVFGGALGQELKAKYLAKLAVRGEELRKQLLSHPDDQPLTSEQKLEIQKKAQEYRDTLPKQILEQMLQEFEGKDVTATWTDQTWIDTPGSPISVDKSALFPVAEISSGKELLLVKSRSKISNTLPFETPEVQLQLVEVYNNRVASYKYRQVAFELLKRNPYQAQTSLCSDPIWPCVKTDSKSLIDALFEEDLLSGQSLGDLTSTVGHPELLRKVRAINGSLFSAVLSIPNP